MLKSEVFRVFNFLFKVGVITFKTPENFEGMFNGKNAANMTPDELFNSFSKFGGVSFEDCHMLANFVYFFYGLQSSELARPQVADIFGKPERDAWAKAYENLEKRPDVRQTYISKNVGIEVAVKYKTAAFSDFEKFELLQIYYFSNMGIKRTFKNFKELYEHAASSKINEDFFFYWKLYRAFRVVEAFSPNWGFEQGLIINSDMNISISIGLSQLTNSIATSFKKEVEFVFAGLDEDVTFLSKGACLRGELDMSSNGLYALGYNSVYVTIKQSPVFILFLKNFNKTAFKEGGSIITATYKGVTQRFKPDSDSLGNVKFYLSAKSGWNVGLPVSWANFFSKLIYTGHLVNITPFIYKTKRQLNTNMDHVRKSSYNKSPWIHKGSYVDYDVLGENSTTPEFLLEKNTSTNLIDCLNNLGSQKMVVDVEMLQWHDRVVEELDYMVYLAEEEDVFTQISPKQTIISELQSPAFNEQDFDQIKEREPLAKIIFQADGLLTGVGNTGGFADGEGNTGMDGDSTTSDEDPACVGRFFQKRSFAGPRERGELITVLVSPVSELITGTSFSFSGVKTRRAFKTQAIQAVRRLLLFSQVFYCTYVADLRIRIYPNCFPISYTLSHTIRGLLKNTERVLSIFKRMSLVRSCFNEQTQKDGEFGRLMRLANNSSFFYKTLSTDGVLKLDLFISYSWRGCWSTVENILHVIDKNSNLLDQEEVIHLYQTVYVWLIQLGACIIKPAANNNNDLLLDEGISLLKKILEPGDVNNFIILGQITGEAETGGSLNNIKPKIRQFIASINKHDKEILHTVQFLRDSILFFQAKKFPTTYIYQDATSNVFQHYTALFCNWDNKKICSLTGLRQDSQECSADVYNFVVDKIRETMCSGDAFFLKALKDAGCSIRVEFRTDLVSGITRALVKKFVMSIQYGLTTKGFRDYVLGDYQKLQIWRQLTRQEGLDFVKFLHTTTLEALKELPFDVSSIIKYFKQSLRVAKNSFRWVSSTGAPVVLDVEKRESNMAKRKYEGLARDIHKLLDNCANKNIEVSAPESVVSSTTIANKKGAVPEVTKEVSSKLLNKLAKALSSVFIQDLKSESTWVFQSWSLNSKTEKIEVINKIIENLNDKLEKYAEFGLSKKTEGLRKRIERRVSYSYIEGGELRFGQLGKKRIDVKRHSSERNIDKEARAGCANFIHSVDGGIIVATGNTISQYCNALLIHDNAAVSLEYTTFANCVFKIESIKQLWDIIFNDKNAIINTLRAATEIKKRQKLSKRQTKVWREIGEFLEEYEIKKEKHRCLQNDAAKNILASQRFFN